MFYGNNQRDAQIAQQLAMSRGNINQRDYEAEIARAEQERLEREMEERRLRDIELRRQADAELASSSRTPLPPQQLFVQSNQNDNYNPYIPQNKQQQQQQQQQEIKQYPPEIEAQINKATLNVLSNINLALSKGASVEEVSNSINKLPDEIKERVIATLKNQQGLEVPSIKNDDGNVKKYSKDEITNYAKKILMEDQENSDNY